MRPSIVHLTIVEMRRALHRRLVRWMILLAVALSALAGAIVFVTSRDPVALARERTHPAHMASWWAGGGEDSLLLTAAIFLVVGAAICGASVAGAEWKAGTITTALTWEPSRLRLHAARTASAAILAFAIGFALQVVFLRAAVPAVAAQRRHRRDRRRMVGRTAAGDDPPGVDHVARRRAGGEHRRPSGETRAPGSSRSRRGCSSSNALVAALRPQLARFMIGENVATVIPWSQLTDVEFERPPIVALVTLLAYLTAVVAGATASFARRDVVTV